MFKVYTLILIVLFCATADIEGKKGTGSSPSRGGMMSKIKNSITSRIKNRISGRPQQPVRTNVGGGYPRQTGMGYPPRSNTGWKMPAAGAGAGALGGYGGYKWAKNAQRSSWGRSRNRGMLTGTLGALAGSYMGYKVGRGMGRYSHYHNGRNYWYGSRYYQPTMGRRTCVFELDESTPNWNVRYDTDNSMVREVIFECFSYEQCCELSCCRAPHHMSRNSSHSHRAWRWWHTLLLFVLLAYCQQSLSATENIFKPVLRVVFVMITTLPPFCTVSLSLVTILFARAGIVGILIDNTDTLALLLTVLGIIFMACMFAAAKLFQSRRQPEMVTLGHEADESRKPFYEPNAYPPSYPAQSGHNAYGYAQQPPPYPAATNYAPAY